MDRLLSAVRARVFFYACVLLFPLKICMTVDEMESRKRESCWTGNKRKEENAKV